jgi:hypothetical protein
MEDTIWGVIEQPQLSEEFGNIQKPRDERCQDEKNEQQLEEYRR